MRTNFSRVVSTLLRNAPVILVVLALPARAQQTELPTGMIVGRVIDARTGAPLPHVGVQVVGSGAEIPASTLGAQTSVTGQYRIARIPAGTVTLQFRRIGYQPKTITGIYLEPGKTIEQDVVLPPAETQTLEAIVATAEAERGTVNQAIDAQRNASGVLSAIGAQQISRSPDGDAAQVLARVPGVNLMGGKFPVTRGLGDRYTQASLNGARIPSPEPEKKTVPLDIFPSGLLQSVTVSKTFMPNQPGDFSGGLIDLKTREFPGAREITYSLSVGRNDAVTGRQIFTGRSAGLEWLGFGSSNRRLPGVVAQAGSFDRSFSPDEYNKAVSSFRNSWSARRTTGSPSTSTSMSLGGTSPIFGHDIGYVGALTYSYGQEVRANEVRAFAVPTPSGGTESVDRYVGSTGLETVLWGGVLNMSSLVGSRSRFVLNNTFTRSADNEARYEEGFDENTALPFQLTRLRYVERATLSSQLAGEHELSDRDRLEWAVTGARVTRSEPDRSEVAYARDTEGGKPFLFSSSEGAVRTFGDLSEASANVNADYSRRLGTTAADHWLKFGTLFRYTTRDSRVDSYSLQATLPRSDRELTPEEIFDGRFTQPGSNVFRVSALAQAGSYSATDALVAGYGMLEYQLSSRYRLIGGARVEHQRLDVDAKPSFGSAETVKPTYTDILPSLTLNVALRDHHTLRIAATQTLARPEYREIAPIASRDVLGGEQFRGNLTLRRTLIQNADVRWEWYPERGEVVSLALFAKHFDKPIERVYRGTSGTRVTTFENARSATNYGVEVELRKGLGFAAPVLRPLSVFSNVTVMRSTIDIGDIGAGSVQPTRAMVGQAPYVVNAGVTFSNDEGGLTATALYNVVGRRIFAASLLPLPSVYEEARQMVDLSIRLPIGRALSAKIDAKNLLNAPYEVTQGSVQREYHLTGRSISAGMSWKR